MFPGVELGSCFAPLSVFTSSDVYSRRGHTCTSSERMIRHRFIRNSRTVSSLHRSAKGSLRKPKTQVSSIRPRSGDFQRLGGHVSASVQSPSTAPTREVAVPATAIQPSPTAGARLPAGTDPARRRHADRKSGGDGRLRSARWPTSRKRFKTILSLHTRERAATTRAIFQPVSGFRFRIPSHFKCQRTQLLAANA